MIDALNSAQKKKGNKKRENLWVEANAEEENPRKGKERGGQRIESGRQINRRRNGKRKRKQKKTKKKERYKKAGFI